MDAAKTQTRYPATKRTTTKDTALETQLPTPQAFVREPAVPALGVADSLTGIYSLGVC